MSAILDFTVDNKAALQHIGQIDQRLREIGATANLSNKNLEKISTQDFTKLQGSMSQVTKELQKANSVQATLFDRMHMHIRRANSAWLGLRNTIGQVITAGDRQTNIENRLKVVAGEELAKPIELNLRKMAREARVPLAELSSVYQRFHMVLAETYDTKKILEFTDVVNKAGIMSGASTAELSGALLQFSQAMGNNWTTAAQELNSINEQAPMVAKLIANSLGVSTGQLKKLAEEGGISTTKVFEGIIEQADDIQEKFERMNIPVGQGWTVFAEGLSRAAAELDRSINLTSSLAKALMFLGDYLPPLAKDLSRGIDALKTGLSSVLQVGALAAGMVHAVVGPALSYLNKTASEVIGWANNLYTLALGPIKQFIDYVYSGFENLYIAVVGNSFWPDTILGIAAWAKMLSPLALGRVVLFTGAVATVFYALYKQVSENFDLIKLTITETFKSMTSGINFSGVKSKLSQLTEPLTSAYGQRRREGQGIIASSAGAVKDLISQTKVYLAAKRQINSVKRVLSDLVPDLNRISSGFKAGYKHYRDIGKSIVGSLKHTIKDLWSGSTASTAFKAGFKKVGQAYQASVTWLQNLILGKQRSLLPDRKAGLVLGIEDLTKKLGRAISDLRKGLRLGQAQLRVAFHNLLYKTLGDSYTRFRKARRGGDSFAEALDAAFNPKSGLTGFKRTLLDASKLLSNALEPVVSTVSKITKEAASMLGDGVRNVWETAAKTVGKGFKSFQDLLRGQGAIGSALSLLGEDIGLALEKGLGNLKATASTLAAGVAVALATAFHPKALGILKGVLTKGLPVYGLMLTNNPVMMGWVSRSVAQLANFVGHSFDKDFKPVAGKYASEAMRSIYTKLGPDRNSLQVVGNAFRNIVNSIGVGFSSLFVSKDTTEGLQKYITLVRQLQDSLYETKRLRTTNPVAEQARKVQQVAIQSRLALAKLELKGAESFYKTEAERVGTTIGTAIAYGLAGAIAWRLGALKPVFSMLRGQLLPKALPSFGLKNPLKAQEQLKDSLALLRNRGLSAAERETFSRVRGVEELTRLEKTRLKNLDYVVKQYGINRLTYSNQIERQMLMAQQDEFRQATRLREKRKKFDTAETRARIESIRTRNLKLSRAVVALSGATAGALGGQIINRRLGFDNNTIEGVGVQIASALGTSLFGAKAFDALQSIANKRKKRFFNRLAVVLGVGGAVGTLAFSEVGKNYQNAIFDSFGWGDFEQRWSDQISAITTMTAMGLAGSAGQIASYVKKQAKQYAAKGSTLRDRRVTSAAAGAAAFGLLSSLTDFGPLTNTVLTAIVTAGALAAPGLGRTLVTSIKGWMPAFVSAFSGVGIAIGGALVGELTGVIGKDSMLSDALMKLGVGERMAGAIGDQATSAIGFYAANRLGGEELRSKGKWGKVGFGATAAIGLTAAGISNYFNPDREKNMSEGARRIDSALQAMLPALAAFGPKGMLAYGLLEGIRNILPIRVFELMADLLEGIWNGIKTLSDAILRIFYGSKLLSSGYQPDTVGQLQEARGKGFRIDEDYARERLGLATYNSSIAAEYLPRLQGVINDPTRLSDSAPEAVKQAWETSAVGAYAETLRRSFEKLGEAINSGEGIEPALENLISAQTAYREVFSKSDLTTFDPYLDYTSTFDVQVRELTNIFKGLAEGITPALLTTPDPKYLRGGVLSYTDEGIDRIEARVQGAISEGTSRLISTGQDWRDNLVRDLSSNLGLSTEVVDAYLVSRVIGSEEDLTKVIEDLAGAVKTNVLAMAEFSKELADKMSDGSLTQEDIVALGQFAEARGLSIKGSEKKFFSAMTTAATDLSQKGADAVDPMAVTTRLWGETAKGRGEASALYDTMTLQRIAYRPGESEAKVIKVGNATVQLDSNEAAMAASSGIEVGPAVAAAEAPRGTIKDGIVAGVETAVSDIISSNSGATLVGDMVVTATGSLTLAEAAALLTTFAIQNQGNEIGAAINEALQRSGEQIISDAKAVTTEEVKTAVISAPKVVGSALANSNVQTGAAMQGTAYGMRAFGNEAVSMLGKVLGRANILALGSDLGRGYGRAQELMGTSTTFSKFLAELPEFGSMIRGPWEWAINKLHGSQSTLDRLVEAGKTGSSVALATTLRGRGVGYEDGTLQLKLSDLPSLLRQPLTSGMMNESEKTSQEVLDTIRNKLPFEEIANAFRWAAENPAGSDMIAGMVQIRLGQALDDLTRQMDLIAAGSLDTNDTRAAALGLRTTLEEFADLSKEYVVDQDVDELFNPVLAALDKVITAIDKNTNWRGHLDGLGREVLGPVASELRVGGTRRFADGIRQATGVETPRVYALNQGPNERVLNAWRDTTLRTAAGYFSSLGAVPAEHFTTVLLSGFKELQAGLATTPDVNSFLGANFQELFANLITEVIVPRINAAEEKGLDTLAAFNEGISFLQELRPGIASILGESRTSRFYDGNLENLRLIAEGTTQTGTGLTTELLAMLHNLNTGLMNSANKKREDMWARYPTGQAYQIAPGTSSFSEQLVNTSYYVGGASASEAVPVVALEPASKAALEGAAMGPDIPRELVNPELIAAISAKPEEIQAKMFEILDLALTSRNWNLDKYDETLPENQAKLAAGAARPIDSVEYHDIANETLGLQNLTKIVEARGMELDGYLAIAKVEADARAEAMRIAAEGQAVFYDAAGKATSDAKAALDSILAAIPGLADAIAAHQWNQANPDDKRTIEELKATGNLVLEPNQEAIAIAMNVESARRGLENVNVNLDLLEGDFRNILELFDVKSRQLAGIVSGLNGAAAMGLVYRGVNMSSPTTSSMSPTQASNARRRLTEASEQHGITGKVMKALGQTLEAAKTAVVNASKGLLKHATPEVVDTGPKLPSVGGVPSGGGTGGGGGKGGGGAAEEIPTLEKALEDLRKQAKKTIEGIIGNIIELGKMDDIYFAEVGLEGAQTLHGAMKEGIGTFLKTGDLKDAVKGFMDTMTSAIIDTVVDGFVNSIFNKHDLAEKAANGFSKLAGLGAKWGGGDMGDTFIPSQENKDGKGFAAHTMSVGAFQTGQGIAGTVPVTVMNPGALTGGEPMFGGLGGKKGSGDPLADGLNAAMGGGATPVVDPLGSALQTAMGGEVQTMMGGLMGGLQGMLSGILGGLGSIFKNIFGMIFSAIPAFADGGIISGPGTGTSDSILAQVSNGEFIVNAQSTKRFRPYLEAINSNKRNTPAFASGGVVGPSNAKAFEATATTNDNSTTNQQVNLNFTGDISRQTKREVYGMIPQLASAINAYNKENGRGKG